MDTPSPSTASTTAHAVGYNDEPKYGSTIGTIHIHQHPMWVTGVGGFSKDDQKADRQHAKA